jgi:hypothetical protein
MAFNNDLQAVQQLLDASYDPYDLEERALQASIYDHLPKLREMIICRDGIKSGSKEASQKEKEGKLKVNMAKIRSSTLSKRFLALPWACQRYKPSL